MKKYAYLIMSAALIWGGCGDGGNPAGPAVKHGSFADARDGKAYRTVEIGNLVWMAENLNYDIPDNTADVCYENSADSCKKYGRLYTWASAMNFAEEYNETYSGRHSDTTYKHQGICPEGWRVPRESDWDNLTAAAGDSGTAGVKLKSKTGWNGGGSGTNDFGFSAAPGGARDLEGGFWGAGNNGFWWSTRNLATQGFFRGISHASGHVGSASPLPTKLYGFSVRCVTDVSD